MLDAGPLGMLAHPHPHAEIAEWLDGLIAARIAVIIPEIADYEVRRSFVLHRLHNALARLDDLARLLIYLPITTSVMQRAAQFWADARRRGRPTADPKGLDCDVILAA